MKIKINTTVAGKGWCYKADSVVDAPDDRAGDLVSAGHAELASDASPSKPASRLEKRRAAKSQGKKVKAEGTTGATGEPSYED